MAIARRQLVDLSVTRWYHCVTRCVRSAFLLGEGPDDRKGWIEHRVQELAQIFAVAVGGFSVLDNHMHLLLRLAPDIANATREQVEPRYASLNPIPIPWLDPSEVSKAVLFLASDDARFISGTTVDVDCGSTATMP